MSDVILDMFVQSLRGAAVEPAGYDREVLLVRAAERLENMRQVIERLQGEASRLKGERDRLISKAIVHHPNGGLAVVAGWRLADAGREVGVTPCFQFCKTADEAIVAVRAAAGLPEEAR